MAASAFMWVMSKCGGGICIQCRLHDADRGGDEYIRLAGGQHVDGLGIGVGAVIQHAETMAHAHFHRFRRMCVTRQPHVGLTRLLGGGANFILGIQYLHRCARLQRTFTRQQELDDFCAAFCTALDEGADGVGALAMFGNAAARQIDVEIAGRLAFYG